MSQKYGPRRFQHRVARLATTKTRPCSSNQTFAHLGQMRKLWGKKCILYRTRVLAVPRVKNEQVSDRFFGLLGGNHRTSWAR